MLQCRCLRRLRQYNRHTARTTACAAAIIQLPITRVLHTSHNSSLNCYQPAAATTGSNVITLAHYIQALTNAVSSAMPSGCACSPQQRPLLLLLLPRPPTMRIPQCCVTACSALARGSTKYSVLFGGMGCRGLGSPPLIGCGGICRGIGVGGSGVAANRGGDPRGVLRVGLIRGLLAPVFILIFMLTLAPP